MNLIAIVLLKLCCLAQADVMVSPATKLDGTIIDMIWVTPTPSTSRGSDPNEQVVFVVTSNHTLFRSEDAAWSWRSDMQKLPKHAAHEHGGQVPPVGVTKLLHSTADPSYLIFEGTHGNFWYSRDAGRSYRLIPKMWRSLILHPKDKNLVLGINLHASHKFSVLQVSRDFGASWTHAADHVSTAVWASAPELKRKPNALYATIFDESKKQAALYKSYDLFAERFVEVSGWDGSTTTSTILACAGSFDVCCYRWRTA